MFVTKAAFISNHHELGIHVQPYVVAPNLTSVALQFSLITGHRVVPATLQWLLHGNILFVTHTDDRRLPFHFSGCEHHKLSFAGPTLAFFCPLSKQDRASHLAISGSWAHIVKDLEAPDIEIFKGLFSPGRGTVQLDRATRPLRSIDGRDDERDKPSGTRERAKSAPENFDEPDDLTDMFETLNAIGFDTKLIQMGDEVVGIMATGKEQTIERELCDDPGFYADRPVRAHSISLSIMAEVSFDPIHYPGPTSFVSSLLAGYMRALYLNVNANYVEPEYAEEMLNLIAPFIELCSAQREAEPAMVKLESPLLAKLPDEEGGMGR